MEDGPERPAIGFADMQLLDARSERGENLTYGADHQPEKPLACSDQKTNR